MDGLSFGSTITTLTDAMKGAGSTHEAIANNIANVNTPNYRRTEVTFKDSLRAQEPDAPAGDDLQLATDDDRDLDPQSAGVTPPPFEITKKVDEEERMRADGSNVDVDQEMAKLSMNSGYAEMMNTLLTTQYSRIRQSIQEQA
jgi:flagellar basal-body rod protein FlgB